MRVFYVHIYLYVYIAGMYTSTRPADELKGLFAAEPQGREGETAIALSVSCVSDKGIFSLRQPLGWVLVARVLSGLPRHSGEGGGKGK